MLHLKDLYALLANNIKHKFDVDKQIELRLSALGYEYDDYLNNKHLKRLADHARKMGAHVENEADLQPNKVYYRCPTTNMIATVLHSGEFGEALSNDLVVFTTEFRQGESSTFQSVAEFVSTPIATKHAVVTYLRQLVAA